MTAQVAIMNERCVAAASDSTMTLGSGERRRTVQSADKMFDLGELHRIAVLVSGSALFMQVPYDVLIGEWKGTLRAPLPTLNEYASSFCAWLLEQRALFDEARQRDHFNGMAREYFLGVRNGILQRLASQHLDAEPWDDINVAAAVDAEVEAWLAELNHRDNCPPNYSERDRAFLEACSDELQSSFNWAFDDTPRTVRSDHRLLNEVPGLLLTKAEPWNFEGTIAFVGYGEREIFPGHQVVVLSGIVANRLLARWWEPTRVSPSDRSILTPFAQSEAIHTFLRAFNADFLTAAHRRLDAVLESVVDSPEELEPVAEAAHSGLEEDFGNLSWDRFVRPMLATVESLHRMDIARMAESLVGLQALRAASSEEQPTVGGPIDVLVISRDHGVEWVRRKNGA